MSDKWREEVREIGIQQPTIKRLAGLLADGSYVSKQARHELVQVGVELRLLKAIRDAAIDGSPYRLHLALHRLREWYLSLPEYAERDK